jgi:hypothetical protein
MHDPHRRAPIPDRHVEGIDHQIRTQPLAHRPADDATTPRVQHRRHVQPAFIGRHIRHVGHPELIGPGRCKIALDEIGRRNRAGILACGAAVSTPMYPCQSNPVHQARDAFPSAAHTPRSQLRVHPRYTIRAPAALMDVVDLRQQSLIHLRTC